MTPKEKLFLLLIVLAVGGVLWQIPTAESNRARKADASPVNWSAASSADGPIRLSWLGVPGLPAAKPESWIQRHLEQKFNLRFTPIFLDYNAYSKRKPLMYCAGEVPDVSWEGDPVLIQRCVRNGFLLQIPYEVIAKYAPDYLAALDKYAPQAWLYSLCDGKNYGVPTFAVNTAAPIPPLWRADWLRNVGLAGTPDTLEEMHEAFRRFTFDDPDRNGRNDTYGASPTVSPGGLFPEVFAACDVLPFDFMEKDGRVVWGGIQPEAKQALGLLREWKREGLIDPDYIVNSVINKFSERKFVGGETGYLSTAATYRMFCHEDRGQLIESMAQTQPGCELAPAPPLRDAQGVRKGRAWGYPAHVICFSSRLAHQPWKVVRVLQMLNALAADRELYLEARLGERGKMWDYSPERGIFFLSAFRNARQREEEAIHRNDISSAYGFFAPCSLAPDKLSNVLPPEYARFSREYARPEWAFSNALGKSDVVPSAGRVLADLNQFQLLAYIEIINGRRSLDSFDDFAQDWRKRGGEKLLHEAAEAARELKEIEAKVKALEREGEGGHA